MKAWPVLGAAAALLVAVVVSCSRTASLAVHHQESYQAARRLKGQGIISSILRDKVSAYEKLFSNASLAGSTDGTSSAAGYQRSSTSLLQRMLEFLPSQLLDVQRSQSICIPELETRSGDTRMEAYHVVTNLTRLSSALAARTSAPARGSQTAGLQALAAAVNSLNPFAYAGLGTGYPLLRRATLAYVMQVRCRSGRQDGSQALTECGCACRSMPCGGMGWDAMRWGGWDAAAPTPLLHACMVAACRPWP